MRARLVRSFVAWLAAVGLGCGSGANPTAAPSPAPPDTPPAAPRPPELAEPPPDLTFDAAAYPAEFAADQAMARAKYAGKRVEVTGTAHFVGRDATGGSLTLANSDADRDAVNCTLADLEPWKTALPGQTVRVRGTVSGVFPALQLRDCRVVSATGDGPPVVATADLARQFKADPAAVGKAFGGKSLIVTGEVEAVELHKSGAAEVTLTPKGVVPEVRCGFGVWHPADKDQNAKLERGQKVRILSHFLADSDSRKFSLGMGRLLPVTP